MDEVRVLDMQTVNCIGGRMRDSRFFARVMLFYIEMCGNNEKAQVGKQRMRLPGTQRRLMCPSLYKLCT